MKVLFKKFCQVRTLEEFVDVLDNTTEIELKELAKKWAENTPYGSKGFTVKIQKLGEMV